MVDKIILFALLFIGLNAEAAFSPLQTTNGGVSISDTKKITFSGFTFASQGNGKALVTSPGGTIRSIQPSGDNGVTFNTTSISGNGGGLRATFNSALYQPSNGNLTTWAGKAVPTGVVVGTTDTQTLTNKTSNGTILKNLLTINGNTLSIPALTQGDILFSKIASSLTRLAKGTNHYALKTNGNTLAWESDINSGGTVTSVAASGDNGLTILSGSPITTSGTITYSLGAITPFSVNAQSTVAGSNLSGTNTGDQTISLTGDVTGSGTGSFATTVASQTSANWIAKVSDETGTSKWVFNGSPSITSPTLTSATLNRVTTFNGNTMSLPSLTQGDLLHSKVAGSISRLAKGTNHYRLTTNGNALTWESTASPGNNLSYFAATTSAQLAGVISDETGSSKLVFNGSPSITSATITNPTLNRTLTLNGTTFSLPALTQGDILFAKTTSTVKPLAKGTNHYALKVNGNRLAWEPLSAGGASEWTNNGTAIYPNAVTTNVAVGYDGNKGKFNVNGDIAFKAQTTPTLDMMGDEPRLYVKTSTGNLTFLKWDGMTQTEYSLIPSGTSITSGGTSTDNHVPVWVGSGGNELEDTPMVIDPMMGDASGLASLSISGGGMSNPLVVSTNNLVADGSNVGIGTASPDHKLDVVGISEFSDQIDIANNKYISWSDGMSYTNIIGLNSSNNLIIQGADGMMSGGHIIIKPAQVEAMRLDKNGQVGIWDQSPDALLDVNGSFLAKSFSFNGTSMSLPTLTQGDLLFAKEASTLQRLAKGTNHYALKVNGNRLAYEPLTTGTVTSVAISGDNGVNILSGSPITSTGTIALSIGNITPNKVNATGTINGTTFIPSNGESMLSLVNYGNGGSAKTIDPKRGNFIYMQLNGSTCAIKIAKPNGPTRFVLALRQFSATRLATWNGDINWPAATAPTLSATSGYIDFVTCVHMGSTVLSNEWNCQFAGDLR